ncbi:hypothetical protein TNCV_3815611 [Trichonephila clavipes]|nr:hypothetical protein TNCV_3815611 [Trichonephila clavipes]
MTGNGKLFHGVNFLGRNGWKMVLQHLMTRSFHWVRDPENVLARVTVELFESRSHNNSLLTKKVHAAPDVITLPVWMLCHAVNKPTFELGS